MRTALVALAGCFLLSACQSFGKSENWDDDAPCYDFKVRGKAIAQLPTPFPNDPDYIVISWPWFIDLEVTRVMDGKIDPGTVKALAVLHSAYVDKQRTWLLRKNSLGGLNILRLTHPRKAQRCRIGAPAASPFLRPSDGETLADLRASAEAKWKAEVAADEAWLQEHGYEED